MDLSWQVETRSWKNLKTSCGSRRRQSISAFRQIRCVTGKTLGKSLLIAIRSTAIDCSSRKNWTPCCDRFSPAKQGSPGKQSTPAKTQTRRRVKVTYRDREDFDFRQSIAEVVAAESVPMLPSLRYKLAGLRRREVWKRVWELQREEDRLTTTKNTKENNGMSQSFRVFSVFPGSTNPQ